MEPYPDPSMMPHLYYPQPMMGPMAYPHGSSSTQYPPSAPPYLESLDTPYQPVPPNGGLQGMVPGASPVGYLPPAPYDNMYGTPSAGYMASQSGYTCPAPVSGMGSPVVPPSVGSPMMYSGALSQSPTVQSGVTDVQVQQSNIDQFNLNPATATTTTTATSMPRPPALKPGIVRPTASANLFPPAGLTRSPVRMMSPPEKQGNINLPGPHVPEKVNNEHDEYRLVSRTNSEGLLDINAKNTVEESMGLSSSQTSGDNVKLSTQQADSNPESVMTITPKDPLETIYKVTNSEIPSNECPSKDKTLMSNLEKLPFNSGQPMLPVFREGEDYKYYEADNKYNCLKCNYATNRWDKIGQHILAHRGNFICTECGKAFIKACDLERHMSAHIAGRVRRQPPLGKAKNHKSASLAVKSASMETWHIAHVTGGSEVAEGSAVHCPPQNNETDQTTAEPLSTPTAGSDSDKHCESNCDVIHTEQIKAVNLNNITAAEEERFEFNIAGRTRGVIPAPLAVHLSQESSSATPGLEAEEAHVGGHPDSSASEVTEFIAEKDIKKEKSDDMDGLSFTAVGPVFAGLGLESQPSCGSVQVSTTDSCLDLIQNQSGSSLPPTPNQLPVPPHAFRNARGLIPRRDPHGRNFRCTLCSYSTRDSWHLEKHYLAHTRQYKICRYCGKAFERPSDLVRHHERHVKRMLESQMQKASDFPASSHMPGSTDTKLQILPYDTTSGPPLQRLSTQRLINRPFQGLTASSPRARKTREYFHCDMCNFKFISQIALKVHKKQVHHASVIRMDMYQKSVLTFTCLLEMEMTNKNEVTVHPSLAKVEDMIKPDLQVPPVSDITDVHYIIDCAKRSGLPVTHTANTINQDCQTSSNSHKMNETCDSATSGKSKSSASSGLEDVSFAPVAPESGIHALETFMESKGKRDASGFSGGLDDANRSGVGSDGILTSDMLLKASPCLQTPNGKCVKLKNDKSFSTVRAVSNQTDRMQDSEYEQNPETVFRSNPNGKDSHKESTKSIYSSWDDPPKQFISKYESCHYKCDKCNYGTNMKHKLDQHLLAHRGRYICKVCGKAFIKTSDLVRHWPSHAVAHIGRMLKCDSCTFQTSHKNLLEIHMKLHYCPCPTSTSAGQRVGQDSAGKDLVKKDLQNNQVEVPVFTSTRAKLRPVKPGRKRTREKRPEVDYGFGFTATVCYCPDCGNMFRSARALSNHRYEEHNDDDKDTVEDADAPPVYCKYCNKEFKSVTKLHRHEAMHMDYSALERQRKGGGQTCVRCEYCLKIFNSKFYLKEHINIHTGLKPYECELCHKKFAIRATMINHMKKLCDYRPAKAKKKKVPTATLR